MIATHNLNTNSPVCINPHRVELIEDAALPDRDNALIRFDEGPSMMTVPGYAETLAALGDAFRSVTLTNTHKAAVNVAHVLAAKQPRPSVVVLSLASGGEVEVAGDLKTVGDQLK